MNNKQLDMVLGYLNEGIEIDEFEFMIESFTESCKIFDFVNENEEAGSKQGIINKILEFFKKVGKFIKDSLLKFLQFIKRKITESKAVISELTGKGSYSYKEIKENKINNLINDIEAKKSINDEGGYYEEIWLSDKDFMKKYNNDIDRYIQLSKKIEKLCEKLAKQIISAIDTRDLVSNDPSGARKRLYGTSEEADKEIERMRTSKEIMKNIVDCITYVVNENNKSFKKLLKVTGKSIEIKTIDSANQ